MSNKVKIIIEIPKEMHEALLNGYEEPYSRMFSDVVKNGIPLDDVKFHIEHMVCKQYEHRLTLDRQEVIKILDNIGKESEDK